MSNRLETILDIWQKQKDQLDWVLATIIETDGSAYRKASSIMLINSLGQHYGLLSGGCLEADIMRQARSCWESQSSKIIQYDMREEGDLAWQLGIGCGGMVRILMQPVAAYNHYQQLDILRSKLANRLTCVYLQAMEPQEANTISAQDQHPEFASTSFSLQSSMFKQLIKPAPHLAVLGGGIDAQPLVNMAAQLGWHISLSDPRTSYARQAYFPAAQHIYNQAYSDPIHQNWCDSADMLVIMHHNIELDGQALSLAQQSQAAYIGLLGPTHRTQKVMEAAQLDALSKPLANPIGLGIGGDLPESISLSILAEAHAVIEKRNGQSLSKLLP